MLLIIMTGAAGLLVLLLAYLLYDKFTFKGGHGDGMELEKDTRTNATPDPAAIPPASKLGDDTSTAAVKDV